MLNHNLHQTHMSKLSILEKARPNQNPSNQTPAVGSGDAGCVPVLTLQYQISGKTEATISVPTLAQGFCIRPFSN